MTRFVKTDWTQPSAELYVADRVTCGFPSYVSQVLPLSPETTLIVLIFFFHSSYDDPKILDEISLDDFLFLNLAWVTDILLEQKPLSRGSCTNLVSLINWRDFS